MSNSNSNSNNNNSNGSGGCPVNHGKMKSSLVPAASTTAAVVVAVEEPSRDKCPVKHDKIQLKPQQQQQQQQQQQPKYNPAIGDFDFSQTNNNSSLLSGVQLGTHRQVSTIAKTDSFTPHHQPQANEATTQSSSASSQAAWIYPSEQQYFNAAVKKGHLVNPKDVPAIVQIHNTINERSWQQVLSYETLNGTYQPPSLYSSLLPSSSSSSPSLQQQARQQVALKQFLGRPQDLTFRAQFKIAIENAQFFDRHDWTVSRNGKDVRYIIDFYDTTSATTTAKQLVGVELDVRPACDSFANVYLRIQAFARSVFRPFSMPLLQQQPQVRQYLLFKHQQKKQQQQQQQQQQPKH